MTNKNKNIKENKNKSNLDNKINKESSSNDVLIDNTKNIDKKEIDLDWIDDYQKGINNKNITNNIKKSNKKNKNIIKEKVINTKTNKFDDLKNNSEKYSKSESESESDKISYKVSKIDKKNNIITNRFGFISNSDSESELEKEESELELEKEESELEKEKEKEESELEKEKEESEKEKEKEESEKEESEKEESEKNIITPNMNLSIKLNLDNDIKKNEKELNEEIKINVKQNKKIRQEQKDKKEDYKQKKNKYNFDINANSNGSTNQTNSIVTLYSEKVEVIVGGKKLLRESNIAINSGTKYFVLGSNGIGKTSLLKYIYSKIESKLDVLMIDQDIQIESSEQKISEFILDADLVLYKAKKRMDVLEKIEEMGEEELDEYNRLSEVMYSKEWDKYEAESKRILDGLGFGNPNLPVSILSGGKRMILAIAKALLRKPDILMLDEPTNHLDLDVVIWLTNYLETYKKTLIVITHQIGLVNSLADIIWFAGNPELTGNKVYTIRGKYDKLLKFLDQTEKETNKNYEKFTKKVEELRKKSTPKKDVDEFIKKEDVPRPPKSYVVNMTFDNVIELSTKNIIEFKDVNFGYDNVEPIYSGLNISLSMGSRMVLVGPNGCGKTTFFKLINQLIKPSDGYILSDDRLRVGYYNQQIVDNLPLDLNSIQYLQKLNPKLDSNQCRNILGKLGIKKMDSLDLPTNKIADLSGGQKARVSFASVQMSNPHLILLDEPTNHLDLESIEGLIKGINEFNGGIVVITHDIYLIESIERANIYQVSNSNIIKFSGEFEDYCEMVYSKL